MTTDDQDRKSGRIVVDEDWKAQVQAEKEAADAARKHEPGRPSQPEERQPEVVQPESRQPEDRQPAAGQSETAPESVEPTRSASSNDPKAASRQRPFQVPPASFSVLVSSLAAQAMAALESSLAEPKDSDDERQRAVQPELARHFIDTLGVLETKTQGNLTDEEKLLLSNVLHELRMLFVTVKSKSG